MSLEVPLNIGTYIVFACHKAAGEVGEGFFSLVLECDDESARFGPTTLRDGTFGEEQSQDNTDPDS